jgi:hypothetical protein
MRKFVLALCLLLCSTLAWSADKPIPADSVIKVHISATHIRSYCDKCIDVLLADALLNGKKIELTGFAKRISGRSVLIIPGDYQARLTKDIHNADSTVIRQEYDLLLSGGTVWNCFTSGISE